MNKAIAVHKNLSFLRTYEIKLNITAFVGGDISGIRNITGLTKSKNLKFAICNLIYIIITF
jgi:hypothetical protein